MYDTARISHGLTPPSHALKFGNQKINLHLSGHEFEPKAGSVQVGSGDLCFITDHPIDDVLAKWKAADIEVTFPRSLGQGGVALTSNRSSREARWSIALVL